MRAVLVTLQEAALILGHKSPGSIYRKVKAGELQTFELNGRPMLERDGLEERWAGITQLRKNSPRPQAPREPRRRASDAVQPVAQVADELPDYNESRARAEYEKANLLELERKTKEGLLLRREDVEHGWAKAVNITRTKLLGVPSVAKQRIPHLEIEEVELITELIRDALNELAAGEVDQ